MDADPKLAISLKPTSQLNLRSIPPITQFNIQAKTPIHKTITDYDQLENKPMINGVPLTGDVSLSDLYIVSENTEAGWAAMSDYVPKAGEICLYSDKSKIKVGDGVVQIIDLPFVGEDDYRSVMNLLQNHVDDPVSHITNAERQFWNAKLNYNIDDETLVFTRN